MQKKMNYIVLTILVLVVLYLIVPVPIGLRHLSHLIFTPSDLYVPIVTDNFIFHEKGFSKNYLLKPKYLDIYEIGFLNSKGNIDASYKFEGKIKFEFSWEETLLYEKIVTSSHSFSYVKNDDTKIKNVSLTTFEMPLKGKYKDNVNVKVTVLKSDDNLKQYGKFLNLYIGVSAVP